MAGIYIHIPFCRRACVYCDFHFATSLKSKNDFVRALQAEIALQKNYITDAIETIYFGGGTPSVLTADEIQLIYSILNTYFDLSGIKEITLEANPDDLDEEYLLALKNTVINRLSIGVQSFNDDRLQWMNRLHTAQQAIRAIEKAAALGFRVSLDLIFSLPNMEPAEWEQQLLMAARLPVTHLSAYNLTVEKGTTLFNRIKNNREVEIPDSTARQLFIFADHYLSEQGFNHYEISNYAKAGHEAIHNSNYWKNKPYLGLGPSAHSFNLSERQWNVSNNHQYIQAVMNGSLPSTVEKLTLAERFNEYLMISLRTKKGVDIPHLLKDFGAEFLEYFLNESKVLIQQHYLYRSGDTVGIPIEHWFMADKIISDLFYI